MLRYSDDKPYYCMLSTAKLDNSLKRYLGVKYQFDERGIEAEFSLATKQKDDTYDIIRDEDGLNILSDGAEINSINSIPANFPEGLVKKLRCYNALDTFKTVYGVLLKVYANDVLYYVCVDTHNHSLIFGRADDDDFICRLIDAEVLLANLYAKPEEENNSNSKTILARLPNMTKYNIEIPEIHINGEIEYTDDLMYLQFTDKSTSYYQDALRIMNTGVILFTDDTNVEGNSFVLDEIKKILLNEKAYYLIRKQDKFSFSVREYVELYKQCTNIVEWMTYLIRKTSKKEEYCKLFNEFMQDEKFGFLFLDCNNTKVLFNQLYAYEHR